MTEPQRGIYGIDLGTTYSAVARIDEDGRPVIVKCIGESDTTPSVVYFESEDTVVVGQAAKEAAMVTPNQVVSLIKRKMGDAGYRRTFFGKEFSAPAISSKILAALAGSVNMQNVPEMTDVVITVPAYFGLLEKDSTQTAGKLAGLNVVGIIPEPVAAALSYGLTGNADGKTFLVFDLGGGTFDVTIIRMVDDTFTVLVTDGDSKLGGADWDGRLLNHIAAEVCLQHGDEKLRDDESAMQEFRILAEGAKKGLTHVESKQLNIRYFGTPATVTITRAEFEEMTSDLVDRTVQITERALVELVDRFPGAREQISEVLLVGGSSKMPAIAAALRGRFGWDPKLNEPDLAVAKGAALYAAGQTVKVVPPEPRPGQHDGRNETLDERVRGVSEQTNINEDRLRSLAKTSIVNAIPKAVGVKLVDTSRPDWERNDDASYIKHLIGAQTQLPFSTIFGPRTAAACQDGVQIEIWEQAGDVPSPELAANTQLSEGMINNLGPYRLPAGSPLEITFSVSEQGLIQLTAREPSSGNHVDIEVQISLLSKAEFDEQKAVVTGITASVQ